MNKNYLNNWEKMCRVCTKNIKSKRDIVKLAFVKGSVMLSEMISTIASVQVFEEDELPQKLCSNCYQKIQQSYDLKKQIEESDKLLRAALENTGIVTIDLNCEIKQENFDIKDEEDFSMKDVTEVNEPVDVECKTIVTEESTELPMVGETLKIESPDIQDFFEEIKSKVPKNINTSTGQWKKRCCMCHFLCDTKTELKTHVESEHPNPKNKSKENTKALQCEYCYTGFANKRTLAEHFRKKYVERNFQCSSCGATYKSKTDLANHEKTTHTNIRDFICNVCSKAFAIHKNLLRHMKKHDTEKMYQCHFCSRHYAEKNHLEVHIKGHLNIKDFQCKLCEKAFVAKALLKIHMRKHTGERPHACWCGKAYMHNTDLKRHQFEHSGLRPFKCKYCDRTFLQRSNMKVHERVHTGELPFECEHCKKRFKHHAHWRSHLSKHEQFREDVNNLPTQAFSAFGIPYMK